MKKYVFNEYSPKYKDYFQFELKKLRQALGPDTLIEHIGSTSIPGLGGKGILDILIGVEDNDFLSIKELLEYNGYEYREKASFSERLFFRKDYEENDNIRRVHIHVVELGREEWNKIISFRDYLLQNPEKVKDYEEIKKKAVVKSKGDGAIYKSIKDEFVDKVLEEVLAK